MKRSLLLVAVLGAAAHAQPVTTPDETAPLAAIQDDKQLAQTLVALTQDPAIKVDDPKTRALAQALMTEGVRQLKAKAYDQALANFLEAYGKFPSPKILLNIASTLRDMGRGADAANTYQRYLTDPATGPERMGEVKELLVKLDEELTILTVRVNPKGTEVSIDGGPFITVGSTLLTRVRPGIHLVRARHGGATTEITVNGFEGEQKDVPVELHEDSAPVATTPPENVDGWLITGTKYGTDNARSSERHVRAGYAGPEVVAIVPHYDETDTGIAIVEPPEQRISSGVLGILRIDGKGRGAAGGLGFAWAQSDHVEFELAGLRSDSWGVYAGFRWRFMAGWFRPYAGAGFPLFFFQDDNMTDRIAVGVRGAGGLELMINGHLSVQGDLGYEHFFNVEGVYLHDKTIDTDVLVPTVGVIGRL
ncbi:MAG TPA: hypothetical protein VLT45_15640 [Kofleriaceae bacterium]|nr:hypothetical protein [Kofleriaceae bacterium]